VDFFRHGALPVPVISNEDAERIAAELGLVASADSLGSQQDANFLLIRPDATVLGVLKIANPAFSPAEIAAQDEAAAHLAAAAPWLRTATATHGPVLVPTANGPATARVLRYLGGGTLRGEEYLSPQVVAGIGTVAGEVSRALRYFTHPGLDRVLQWDLRHADRVVATLARHVGDPLRERVQAAARDAWARVQPLAGHLPRQAIHADLTDDNLVCTLQHGLRVPDGVIDFGDLTTSWAVGELATAITSLLRHAGAEPCTVLPAVRAFHGIRPLSPEEAAALWPLVVLRAAVLVVSGEQQAAIDGDNAYVASSLELERRIFTQAVSVPVTVMTALIADALGLGSPPPRVSGRLLARGLDGCTVLDLSSTSDAVDEGAWLEPGLADRLADRELAAGATAVITRFGEAQLNQARTLLRVSPATIATGIGVWLARPAELTAPWPAELRGPAAPPLPGAGAGLVLTVHGVPAGPPAGTRVVAGDLLGRVPAGTRLRVSVRSADLPALPPFIRPEYAAGWLAAVADPTSLLGLEPADRSSGAGDSSARDLLDRRDLAFAPVQEHYYSDPPRIERGWRHHLAGADGRVYLDMVNNVAVLGHSHPRIEAAVARQLRRLNTNSRFNYASVVEFSERLAALLPAPLDTVFLVNSGSEAVDLALRLALATTGHRDVVAVREAYHGWTYATDAVSTSTADNPNALSTRPRWVHAVDAPNSYRGRFRGGRAHRYAPGVVRVIGELAVSGRPPAAFVAEPFYGNAGGIALPDGYLSQVYAEVRRWGGLAIADEVQVGYGRLGHWFWGFEQQGVVPDIVTMAKAMGNGYPLGAVVTSRAVAEKFSDQGYFFSSTGGSPVASVIGMTVLDVLEDEGLQANAARVGDHLKESLTALASRHELIGAVHGSGLYLGVEFVRDRATLEPATEETKAICDRMLDLGVIIQPTSDRMCVLKIKPPLCLDLAGADFFTDALDQVLTEGW
jgi:4-aminobutyrate aminotransferase-like enzyme/Ser/Thr protein kinase RdoA (MazF antagonist)